MITELETRLADCLTELVERSEAQTTQLTCLLHRYNDIQNRLAHLETELSRYGITQPTR